VVPNVVGRLLPKAKTRIKSAHCRLGTVTYVVSSSAKKNRVVSQRPGPGKRLANGSKLKLRVGRGPRH
jgi:beta-lactam-binding protein with PASTA domain